MGRTSGALGFLREGRHSVWTGYAHLAFLFAVLLPTVLRRTETGWEPVGTRRDAFVAVVRIVTAPTIDHSMTLDLAAAGWARLQERWVETAIARNILVAVAASGLGRTEAVGNGHLRSIRAAGFRNSASIAFLFGWIHGFEFAGALVELVLTRVNLAVSLLSFNLGVEAGHLVCVGLFLPLAYWLRRHAAYRRGILPNGSGLNAAAACGWIIDRLSDLVWMLF